MLKNDPASVDIRDDTPDRRGRSRGGWLLPLFVLVVIILAVQLGSWVGTFDLLPGWVPASGESALAADYRPWGNTRPLDLDLPRLATAAARGEADWGIGAAAPSATPTPGEGGPVRPGEAPAATAMIAVTSGPVSTRAAADQGLPSTEGASGPQVPSGVVPGATPTVGSVSAPTNTPASAPTNTPLPPPTNTPLPPPTDMPPPTNTPLPPPTDTPLPPPPPPNSPPNAKDDSATVAVRDPVSINVAANDSDPDGNLDKGSVTIVSWPSHGDIQNIHPETGEVRYKSDSNYTGPDSFTYQICDYAGACDTATVSITVTEK